MLQMQESTSVFQQLKADEGQIAFILIIIITTTTTIVVVVVVVIVVTLYLVQLVTGRPKG